MLQSGTSNDPNRNSFTSFELKNMEQQHEKDYIIRDANEFSVFMPTVSVIEKIHSPV
jgi:hypothetical protein